MTPMAIRRSDKGANKGDRMTRRTGAALVPEGQPRARMRDGLWRRTAAIGGLVGVCCLMGASVASAATPPVFSPVAGSPYATGDAPGAVAFSPSGGLVASANGGDDTVSIFSVSSTGALTEAPGSPDATGDSPNSVAFSPSGGLLATANEGDDTVSMFSVSPSGALTPVGSPVATGSDPVTVAFSPSGGLLVSANQGDNTASVFSVSAGGALSEVPGSPYATGAGPDAVALSSGGLLAIANATDSTLSVFSLASPPATLSTPSASPSSSPARASVIGCPRATGRLHGRTLGQVTLGMTRGQARRRYDHGSMRSSRSEDFFCLNPIGVQVGYASNALLIALPAGERGKLRGRVVLAVSANRLFALRGIHPGATLHTAATRLHLGAVMHIDGGDWYTIRNGSDTGVIDVHHGIVQDVGIANASLTGSRKAQLRFIKRFF
jgi:6-phosphogluconolactonase (cycloisomerase 2 family)